MERDFRALDANISRENFEPGGGGGASKGGKRNEGMAKGRTRSSGRGVGNASFCFRKLERFIVMLI